MYKQKINKQYRVNDGRKMKNNSPVATPANIRIPQAQMVALIVLYLRKIMRRKVELSILLAGIFQVSVVVIILFIFGFLIALRLEYSMAAC
jgi:hypothetical protein